MLQQFLIQSAPLCNKRIAILRLAGVECEWVSQGTFGKATWKFSMGTESETLSIDPRRQHSIVVQGPISEIGLHQALINCNIMNKNRKR